MRSRSHFFEVAVWGDRALFTDPMSKVSGEKISYSVPTYDALRGIMASIYWTPEVEWIIDAVRIINPIETISHGLRPVSWKNNRGIQSATYLNHPRYQIRAHLEWNRYRDIPEEERIWRRYEAIVERMIRKGGRRDIFLGTRDSMGFIEKEKFGSGKGFYDGTGCRSLGVMYHGMDYPDGIPEESEGRHITIRLAETAMTDGFICFPRPEECMLRKPMKDIENRKFRKRRKNGTDRQSL